MKPTLFMEQAFAEANPVTTHTPSVCSAGDEAAFSGILFAC
jgi:hypothetical protein